eukprot:CAMPEP_0182915366 /NCGR_PEP_ID=MMETSP0105_2-20130417/283_1 /TAXON_ID=81532 ORGANISM="Acanthoeca-like sp., Strain 10tr" /NCGR_SAMPLE_ID=MMETSP0105_2 /ASSEMBLY_ACC=CAM_ASM_000205 /LENGTH=293 /DNA_ID=CAMNT_0025052225 /DNA_START=36 /DNA_END=917 /DNA_ORIENTATION=+
MSLGFCPFPHTSRDQAWLAVGAATGLYVGYKLAQNRPAKIGLSGLHLKYWSGRGLMEVPRQMLAIAGIFPDQYTDGRYTTDEEPKHSARHINEVASTFSWNLGRMPCIDVGAQSVGQSYAINYFLAAELDMLGDTTMESAQIISIMQSIDEMKKAANGVVPYGTEPTEEALDKLFAKQPADRSPARADGSKQSERAYYWFLSRIEYLVGDAGFAVGSRLSLADVLLRYALTDAITESQKGKPDIPAYRCEPLMSAKRTAELLADFPKIQKILASVGKEPGYAKWMAQRGPQMF